MIYFSAILFALVAFAARAEEPPVAVHGFVDGYYAWNANQPANHRNFIPGTGTTAVHADEIALNLAAIEFVRNPKPFGFYVSLVGGDGANVVHAGEPGVHGHHRVRNLYQASIAYSKQKLTLEGGVYPSHIGFEGFFSKDNWNYTRGWLGELSPYYQAGVKATFAWNDRWSGQVHVLQGWQLIHDDNHAKALGTQVAYSGPRFGTTLNTFAGAELPNDNKHLRLFGDWIATYKATSQLSVAACVDRGRQQFPGGANANWLGLSAWSRYAFDDRQAVAARVERFRDPQNGISGTPQTVSGATITYEVHPAKNLIVKTEARRDHSTAPVFSKSHGATTHDETLVIVGVVATF